MSSVTKRGGSTVGVPASATAESPKWDCLSCNAALKRILGRDRPSRLMHAITEGMQADVAAAQKLPGTLGSFDCGTTIRAVCEVCPSNGPEGGARAYFMVDPATIVLCVNQMHSGQEEIEEVLVHELVHAYDYCAAKRDLSKCKELAHSEVRAAREAECHYAPTPWFAQSWRDCIREKATRSASQMCRTTAALCVRDVFDDAMADTEPLQTPPVQGLYTDTLLSMKQWWSGATDTTAAAKSSNSNCASISDSSNCSRTSNDKKPP